MTTEKKSENTPTPEATDNKAVFAPLGKYAVIAVIMVSIIVTTAIMLDKQLNTVDQQLAAIEKEVADMHIADSDTAEAATAEIAVEEVITETPVTAAAETVLADSKAEVIATVPATTRDQDGRRELREARRPRQRQAPRLHRRRDRAPNAHGTRTQALTEIPRNDE